MSILLSEGRSTNNGLSMHAYRYRSYYLVRVPTYEKGLVSITLRRNRKNEVPYSRIWVAPWTLFFYRSGKLHLWKNGIQTYLRSTMLPAADMIEELERL